MCEFYLQSILQQLINLENYGGCNVENLELIYRQVVDALMRTSDETIPTCRKNFFKFWWDQKIECAKIAINRFMQHWEGSGSSPPPIRSRI